MAQSGGVVLVPENSKDREVFADRRTGACRGLDSLPRRSQGEGPRQQLRRRGLSRVAAKIALDDEQ